MAATNANPANRRHNAASSRPRRDALDGAPAALGGAAGVPGQGGDGGPPYVPGGSGAWRVIGPPT
ncbi:hypothetical protein [Nonomuraea helvata]|uniref:Uncharacterized protein n=1 Tax=Nonomuraea helvata TaxID=37484 RepID=A0ABV5SFU8_9ACTN